MSVNIVFMILVAAQLHCAVKLPLLTLISGYFDWHTGFKTCSHLFHAFCNGFVFTVSAFCLSFPSLVLCFCQKCEFFLAMFVLSAI